MTIDEVLIKMRGEGRLISDMAIAVNRSETTVLRRLGKLGLTCNGRPDIQDSDVKSLWDTGLTISEIAEKLNCSHETVSKRLKKFGISCSRVDGIRRHFEREHEILWPEIKTGLDAGTAPTALARRHGIGYANLIRLMQRHDYPFEYPDSDTDGNSGNPGPDTDSGTGRPDVAGRFQRFLEKSRAVHGGFYDYSDSEYVNTKTKIKIICPEHGPFMQAPEKHMIGRGCPACARKHGRLDIKNSVQATETKPGPVDRPQERAAVRDVAARPVISGQKVDADDLMYSALVEIFGPFDVERRCVTAAYPYLCDFHIKSRDMYIELNAHWSHGSHWFDGNSKNDLELLSSWDARGPHFRNAVSVWTRRDVEKRLAAQARGLNYLVFWDNDLRDFELWVGSGCPDGQDWLHEYSWLPSRGIDSGRFQWDFMTVGSIPCGAKPVSALVKKYQANAFYHKELALWHANGDFRGLPLRAWLYWNRMKYLNKTPFELSDIEILRGFKIAGIISGYSGFDASLFNEVLCKYHVKSVYDPCAGWGERMLSCAVLGIEYLGLDVNLDLKSGYEAMVRDFDLTRQRVVFQDSGDLNFNPGYQADIAMTCPPYGSLEIYGPNGAENLSHEEFLAWWGRVIDNALKCGIEYFAFQVNRKYRDMMQSVVLSRNFELIDELEYSNPRSSHFTRGKNGVNFKSEKESMLVFRKVGM